MSMTFLAAYPTLSALGLYTIPYTVWFWRLDGTDTVMNRTVPYTVLMDHLAPLATTVGVINA